MVLVSKAFWDHYNSDYSLICWLFLRGLAIVYFSAFASMAVQIEGLVGAEGIIPIVTKLAIIDQFYSDQKFWLFPTVFWFDASDQMLKFVCYLGMGAACLLLLNIFPRTCLVICYLLYLSITYAGQDFTHFQWDVFLLEIGFLAIFLTWGSGTIILLFRWLLAHFMFMGGVVKIASGDPTWANLTALNFHYETQPLPTPLAYYAHHFPTWFQKVSVGGVFFIELFVPFLIFMPRPFRIFACYAIIILQAGILLTGNYTFFNLLAILLCLFLLEDQDVAAFFPKRLSALILQKKVRPGTLATVSAGLWASVVMLVCGTQVWTVNRPTFDTLNLLLRTTSIYSLINKYGPFAVMTSKRNEIIVQGSNDAQQWLDYEFKYKPGNLNRELSWNIPHQPRLDWQMWFAALAPASAKKGSWFDNFLNKLLVGSPQVLSLLDTNPFPEKPPLYIRAILYRYSYTTQEQRDSNRRLWNRQYLGIYWPIRSLNLSTINSTALH